jgi:hypothetical protein
VSHNNDNDDNDAPELDRTALERDIAAGAKAFGELLRNASVDWTHWSATILGLRGLRALAFARAGTTGMQSQAFRNAMSFLLSQQKYSIYNQIDKQTRSDCYRLMNRIEDVDNWYAALPATEKLKWKHPNTIANHCPKDFLEGMRRHNQPKTGKKKPAADAETERVRALLVQAIEIIMEFKPEAAKRLLAQIYPGDPDDSVDDLFVAGADCLQLDRDE